MRSIKNIFEGFYQNIAKSLYQEYMDLIENYNVPWSNTSVIMNKYYVIVGTDKIQGKQYITVKFKRKGGNFEEVCKYSIPLNQTPMIDALSKLDLQPSDIDRVRFEVERVRSTLELYIYFSHNDRSSISKLNLIRVRLDVKFLRDGTINVVPCKDSSSLVVYNNSNYSSKIDYESKKLEVVKL